MTHSYAADPDGPGPQAASPLAASVSDPAGTVLTETNLLAEPVRHVDVFGNATVTTYDALGGWPASRVRPGPSRCPTTRPTG